MKNIDVWVGLRSPVDRLVEVLTTDPASIFQPDARPQAQDTGTFRCGLAIDLADGTTLRHGVVGRVGPATSTSRGVVLGLHFEPVADRHLLPVFDGELEARAADAASQLVLRGGYTVPLGAIGRLGDALAGHRSVERSLQRLVTELAERLEAEAEKGDDSAARTEAPAQSLQLSDYYLG